MDNFKTIEHTCPTCQQHVEKIICAYCDKEAVCFCDAILDVRINFKISEEETERLLNGKMKQCQKPMCEDHATVADTIFFLDCIETVDFCTTHKDWKRPTFPRHINELSEQERKDYMKTNSQRELHKTEPTNIIHP